MRSINAHLSTWLIVLFAVVVYTPMAQAFSFNDSIYKRKSYTLNLHTDGKFTSTDTVFLGLKEGKWKSIKNTIYFFGLQEDTVPVREDAKLVFHSSNKLTFIKDKKRFSYHDLASSNPSPGVSLVSIFKGIIGLLTLFLLGYFFSKDRKSISWKLVFRGTLLQVILSVLILKVPFVSGFFDFLAKSFTKVIDFAHNGATFLFGQPGDIMPDILKNFAFWILPSVIFFSALSSLLYYFGVLQFIVKRMAWVMYRLLGVSGSESVAAAANVFIGQTEAPLLVKPYLSKMTKSEILCLMVGGMATIAGGVLAAVIGILGEGDSIKELFYAKHLLTASIMSAPAAIVFSKILVPETEKTESNLDVAKDKIGVNALEAITNGTTDGLKLAVNVGAMLIVFISLIAFFNYFLGKIGEWTMLNALISHGGMYTSLSFESISGYLLSPLAWLLGVEWQDSMYFGQLLGEKTILNEFIAYPHLGKIQDELSQKTLIMSTYVLCGFANIASIGIQVGGIGILVPEKRSLLAKYGVLALIGGTLACMSTAVLAGILF
jgi:CNT family concentrative nucleoside transporter